MVESRLIRLFCPLFYKDLISKVHKQLLNPEQRIISFRSVWQMFAQTSSLSLTVVEANVQLLTYPCLLASFSVPIMGIFKLIASWLDDVHFHHRLTSVANLYEARRIL